MSGIVEEVAVRKEECHGSYLKRIQVPVFVSGLVLVDDGE